MLNCFKSRQAGLKLILYMKMESALSDTGIDNRSSNYIHAQYQDTSVPASIAASHIPQIFFYADSAPTHLRPELSGAIYQGLYTNRPAQVPSSCSSGEYRFPRQYRLTVICSKCIDITSRIITQRTSNVSFSNMSDSHNKVALDENTLFRLPSGPQCNNSPPISGGTS